ncbi:MAG: hypothetical protein Ct9H300mP7_6300 [Verrucomicrobiota bacterium]|nr:MAG: hypothetical protein Ct9H300mP7_6300 [Verrucomicrobiota bacterium]
MELSVESQYGSKDWSIRDPKKNGRDKVAIPSTKLQPDGKTVVLSLPGLTRAMQFELKFDLDAAEANRPWLDSRFINEL